ncbi:AbrB/MazE/SpoVT family DNA-binding domain-containing protein [Halorientalis halophila]|uniref:AbrB/MazE/SpoVT family DNA-binding domain-containing protein n=1 Tax=Halorientalis halophila TaxID=3108499 RepID=UPI00300BC63E
MSSNSPDESGETYGTAELNHRGRLTIPKSLRDELQLDDGTTFEVVREGGDIRLVRQLPDLETLTRGGEWGDETFRDAGEGTFGGR